MNIKEHVIDIIAELINDEGVKEQLIYDDDLTQFVINSIRFIKLIVAIEETFNIEFEDEALDYTKFVSLNELCDYIEKRKQVVTADGI